jgi:hypothetical protein
MTMQNNPEAFDVFPTVSFDVSYKNLVSNVDIDLLELTGYLRSKGLDDESISRLSIIFTGQTIHDDTKQKNNFTLGSFEPATSTILVNQSPLILAAYRKYAEDSEAPTILEVSCAGKANSTITNTLVHEMAHYVNSFDEKVLVDNAIYFADYRKELLKKATLNRHSAKLGAAVLASSSIPGGAQLLIEQTGLSYDLPQLLGAAVVSMGLLAYGALKVKKDLNEYIEGYMHDKYLSIPDEIIARREESIPREPIIRVEPVRRMLNSHEELCEFLSEAKEASYIHTLE